MYGIFIYIWSIFSGKCRWLYHIYGSYGIGFFWYPSKTKTFAFFEDRCGSFASLSCDFGGETRWWNLHHFPWRMHGTNGIVTYMNGCFFFFMANIGVYRYTYIYIHMYIHIDIYLFLYHTWILWVCSIVLCSKSCAKESCWMFLFANHVWWCIRIYSLWWWH